jgi:hypothetical protein
MRLIHFLVSILTLSCVFFFPLAFPPPPPSVGGGVIHQHSDQCKSDYFPRYGLQVFFFYRRQLIKAYADESAAEDALYFLGEALRR